MQTLQDIGSGKYSGGYISRQEPEELERFKNAPDGFISEQEQQTSDNQSNYKRQ